VQRQAEQQQLPTRAGSRSSPAGGRSERPLAPTADGDGMADQPGPISGCTSPGGYGGLCMLEPMKASLRTTHPSRHRLPCGNVMSALCSHR